MGSFEGGRTIRAIAVVATLVLVATWAIASRGVASWEVDAGQWAYDLPASLTPALEGLMQAGTRVAPLIAAAVLAIAFGWRLRAVGVVVAGLLTWLVCVIVKDLAGRGRPAEATLRREPLETLTNNGFPSSHTAIATAIAVAVVLLGRPRRWLAVLILAVPVLTGLARMHLGVHWLIDVIGGAAIGAVVATGVAYLIGLPPTGPVRRTGTDDELVVATFNLRNGRAWDRWESWPLRARAAADLARRLGADILGVQEAFGFQGRFLGAALPGYEMIGRGRGRTGGEWCAVYVRTDRLRVLDAVTRWYGDEPDVPGSQLERASFPRIGTYARLEVVGTGAQLEVVNTHLDERHPANRRRSVEQLVSWLDGDVPAVVMGDLNATVEDEPELFAVLEAAGLRDVLAGEAAGTAHDYLGGTDHRRIDHIFVSRHWELTDAAIVADDRTRRFPSDHWPVDAHLVLR